MEGHVEGCGVLLHLPLALLATGAQSSNGTPEGIGERKPSQHRTFGWGFQKCKKCPPLLESDWLHFSVANIFHWLMNAFQTMHFLSPPSTTPN